MQAAGFCIDYLRTAPDAEAPAILQQIALARSTSQRTVSHPPCRIVHPIPQNLEPHAGALDAGVGDGTHQPGLPAMGSSAEQDRITLPASVVALQGTLNPDNMPTPESSSGDPVEMARTTASPTSGTGRSHTLPPAAMQAPCPATISKLKLDIVADSGVQSDCGSGHDSAGVLARPVGATSQQEDASSSPLPELSGLGEDPLSVWYSPHLVL